MNPWDLVIYLFYLFIFLKRKMCPLTVWGQIHGLAWSAAIFVDVPWAVLYLYDTLTNVLMQEDFARLDVDPVLSPAAFILLGPCYIVPSIAAKFGTHFTIQVFLGWIRFVPSIFAAAMNRSPCDLALLGSCLSTAVTPGIIWFGRVCGITFGSMFGRIIEQPIRNRFCLVVRLSRWLGCRGRLNSSLDHRLRLVLRFFPFHQEKCGLPHDIFLRKMSRVFRFEQERLETFPSQELPAFTDTNVDPFWWWI